VKGVYYEMISRSIRKDGLRWVPETGEYPMKELFFILDSDNIKHDPSIRLLAEINEGKTRLDQTKNIKIDDLIGLMRSRKFMQIQGSMSSQFMQRIRPSITTTKLGEDLYLSLQYSDLHLPSCPVMISKYYLMGLPITNWHNNLTIKRNSQREDRVFDVYGIDRNSPYSLMNLTYGTPPNLNKTRKMDIKSRNEQRVLMSIEIDRENDICLFDWLGVIENADEIHSVETAFCYLADKYSRTPHMTMHEKRQQNEPNVYYRLTSLVYRNPNWTYYG
jgi:hypothetical protein